MEMSLKIVALRRCCENIELDYMSLNDNYLASAKRVSQAEGREFEPRLPLSVKSTGANQRQSCLAAVFLGYCIPKIRDAPGRICIG